ncbi:MAG: hypothetical protein NTZ05_06190 [Chloroflexi bacterium]|nr:hypothetical protein [Chloroflexota bacterium]
MYSGAPGFELDRAEAMLKKAGIKFSRHTKKVKMKYGPRHESFVLEVMVKNERRMLHQPADVASTIAELANS